MVRLRPSQDGYRELRRRMIRETEAYLSEAGARPGFGVRIPSMEVGRRGFTHTFADGFWSEVLGVPYAREPVKDPFSWDRFGRLGLDRM